MSFRIKHELRRSTRTLTIFVAMTVLVVLSDHMQEAISWFGDLPRAARVERIATFLRLTRGPSVPVTVIDIDEATWTRWQRPAITPRDKLAAIVRVLSQGTPRAVLIDIDLSRGDPHDTDLKAAFRSLNAPLLLPREFDDQDLPRRSTKETAFDEIDSINWISVRFRSNEQGIIDGWRLWEPACKAKPVALPSPHLTLAWLDPAVRRLKKEHSEDLQNAAIALCAGHRLAADFPQIEATTMPFAFGDVKVPFPQYPRIDVAGRDVAALIRLSAQSLVESNHAIDTATRAGSDRSDAELWQKNLPGQQSEDGHRSVSSGQSPSIRSISAEMLHDRVVLIGASHSESGDIHITRYGAMPGVMIIANAIALGTQSITLPQLGEANMWGLSMAIAGLATLAYYWLRFFVFVAFTYLVLIASYSFVSSFFQPASASHVIAGALTSLAAMLSIDSIAAGIAALWRGEHWMSFFRKTPK